MNIRVLLKKEILHSRFGFLTGVFSLTAAVAGLMAAAVILRSHDVTTEQMLERTEKELRSEMARQEDYYRRVMRDMGYNVLIVNIEQDMAELEKLGHPTTYLEYEDVWELARGDLQTLNHLLPVLQERFWWEEGEIEIMLSGIRGQVPVFSKPEFLTDEGLYRSPITPRLPEGMADVGAETAVALGIRPGDRIAVSGEKFTVNRVYARRGNTDDITVWIPLDRAQSILDREGKINGIFALECVCDLDQLGLVTEEVSSILPHAKVFEFTSLIAARSQVRQRAEEAHREVARQILLHRQGVRGEKERFASILVPLLSSAAGIWIFVLVLNNARDRRGEIAILRAVGFTRTAVLRLFLLKSVIMGIAGGILGCLAGIAVGALWAGLGAEGLSLAELLSPRVLAAGLFSAPVLSMCAGFVPAVLAAGRDPADILREE